MLSCVGPGTAKTHGDRLVRNPFRVFRVFRGCSFDRASQLHLEQPRKTQKTRKDNAPFQQGRLLSCAEPRTAKSHWAHLVRNPFRVFRVFRGCSSDRASQLHSERPRKTQKTRKDNAPFQQGRLLSCVEPRTAKSHWDRLVRNPFRVFCVFRGCSSDRASQLHSERPRKTQKTRKGNAPFQQGRLLSCVGPGTAKPHWDHLVRNPFRVFRVFRGCSFDRASQLDSEQPGKTQKTRKDNAPFQQGRLLSCVEPRTSKSHLDHLVRNPFRVFRVFRGCSVDRASQLHSEQPRKTQKTRKDNAPFQQGRLLSCAEPRTAKSHWAHLVRNPFRVFRVFRGGSFDRASQLPLEQPRKTQKTRKDNAPFQ
ncbi:hypothetical protein FF011L_36650 [Roseimaritima multifibrata]|uniref:Uncharacterized protein n=1 Tax=Roseimaritima multifibrata TaxID=1930274 RepID=A0A517MJ22_9BACT|nr:hypothetical protein FF011L_36650 [Roseimaritima multifibrata]